MQVWRICRQRHLATALGGIGAEMVGGRWNRKGLRMVYTSTTLSLASLELFVHLEPNLIPADLYAVCATVPDDCSLERLPEEELPGNWRDYPAPRSLQDLSSQWLLDQRSLVLMVPSAVNPEEFNVLLNPLHPEMANVSKAVSKPFHFDPRMWDTRGSVGPA